jgi:hypothetical protein
VIYQLLLGFNIASPFGLRDGRDACGRPFSGNAGLTAARRGCRSDSTARVRRCVHGARLAQSAEERLKPA